MMIAVIGGRIVPSLPATGWCGAGRENCPPRRCRGRHRCPAGSLGGAAHVGRAADVLGDRRLAGAGRCSACYPTGAMGGHPHGGGATRPGAACWLCFPASGGHRARGRDLDAGCLRHGRSTASLDGRRCRVDDTRGDDAGNPGPYWARVARRPRTVAIYLALVTAVLRAWPRGSGPMRRWRCTAWPEWLG